MKKELDVVIIGGGAAGFFSALSVKQHHPNAKVRILEKTKKILSKVKVSGGGRCNVTHACFDNSKLIEFYPRGGKFLRNGFAQFNSQDTIEWFKKRGVALKTESDGRMFPITDNSQTIIDCFLAECQRLNIEIVLGLTVLSINESKTEVQIETTTGAILCDAAIIASGGGNKASFYDYLAPLQLAVDKPIPSLFTFNMPTDSIRELMGLSVDHVSVKLVGHKMSTSGPLLITHWGMSGPAVLKLSSKGAEELHKLNYHFNVQINWLLDHDVRIELTKISASNSQKLIIKSSLASIPRRLWEYFIKKAKINSDKKWTEISKKEFNRLAELLQNDVYEVIGKTTFKEEFVTCGGISLKEIDGKTMKSKKHDRIYFCGELLNIDGYTGGFNFQAAWTTGFIAGKLN